MIKNFNKLIHGRFSAERTDVLSALEIALKRVDPEQCIKDRLKLYGDVFTYNGKRYHLNTFDHIYLVAFGKAAEKMAKAVLDVFSEIPGLKIVETLVVAKEFKENLPYNVKKIHGGHPIPNINSVEAGKEILKIAEKTTDNDLTFVLISGGGSAMVEKPLVSLDDLQRTTSLLLEAGANIEELNTVRKHLSEIKGGKLLKHLKGQVISIIISDVVGDKLDTIASGPTYFDTSTFQDALKTVNKYYLKGKIPKTVLDTLKMGTNGSIAETLKEDSEEMLRVQNILIATNYDACKEATNYLKGKEYNVLYVGSSIQGEAREVAKVFGGIAIDAFKKRLEIHLPIAVVFGGETTVTVKGSGKGGRNEEFVLSSLPFLSRSKTVLASIGTDGIDGKSNAAGAIADSDTISKSIEKGLNFSHFLENNDAHRFFSGLDDLIMTGSTGTNVADIAILIVGE